MRVAVASNTVPVVLLNDTRVDHHHGCERVITALRTLVSGFGGHISASAPSHTDWTRNDRLLDAIKSARLLLVNGEGTIHHNNADGRRLLEAAAVARDAGIPSVLVNCAWDHNGSEFCDLLRQFTLVAARDSRSAEQMRAAGVTCRIVPDLSLYFAHSGNTGQRSGVGFTDSVLRPASLKLEKTRRDCRGQVMPIQFVPPGPGGTYRFIREYLARSDLQHPQFLTAMLCLRLRQYRHQAPTAEEFLRRLARLELLVSGRFHACTLALAAHTPFIAIASNSHKIQSLVGDAGLASWRVAETISPEAVEHARLEEWSAEEITSIGNYLAHARRAADGFFRDIGRLL
jgi:hypothetical protein